MKHSRKLSSNNTYNCYDIDTENDNQAITLMGLPADRDFSGCRAICMLLKLIDLLEVVSRFKHRRMK